MKLLNLEEKEEINKRYGITFGSENVFLDKVMRFIRKNRKKVEENLKYTCYKEGNILHLWLQTNGCRFSKMGKCTICNYWDGNTNDNIELDVKEALDNNLNGQNTILLNSCGSVLDISEISEVSFDKILSIIDKADIENVILETHVLTLKQERINHIVNMLPNKNIFFELGQESVNKEVLFYCLNKTNDMQLGVDIWKNYCNTSIKIIQNVVIGSPFLSVAERIKDAQETIKSLISEGVDYITVFPINIKEYTLIDFLYKNNIFELVYGREIFYVLSEIPEQYLNIIDIAWFEEKKEENAESGGKIIPPYYCKQCKNEVTLLIKKYNSIGKWQARKDIVNCAMSINCTCSKELEIRLSKNKGSFYKRLHEGYEKIEKYIRGELK